MPTTIGKKILHTQRGSMLLQAMIGVALVGLTSAAMLTVIQHTSKQLNHIDSKMGVQTLSAALKIQFSDPASCIGGLNSKTNFSPTGGASYKFPLDVSLTGSSIQVASGADPKTPKPLPEYGLKIQEFSLKDVVKTGNVFSLDGIDYQNYLGQVELSAQAIKEGNIPFKEVQVSRLLLKVNASSGEIVACGNGLDLVEVTKTSCEAIGGVFNTTTNTCSIQNIINQITQQLTQQFQQQINQLQNQVTAIANSSNSTSTPPASAIPSPSPGPSSGWVSIGSNYLGSCAEGPVTIDTGKTVTVRSAMISTDLNTICKNAGFNSYSGSCQSTHQMNGAQTQGSIVANQSGGSGCSIGGKAQWAMTCMFGYPIYNADGSTKILCTK